MTSEEYIINTTTISKLKDISFFSNMSDHDLTQIAEIIVIKNYKKGAVIIEEMSDAERFFIIYTGKIEITKHYDDDEEFVLSVQSDGDFFGEMALLDEGKRSASVRAIEPTTVMEISRNDFETLLYKAPALAYRIMKELSSRLRETGALLISHLKQRNRQLLKAYVETIRIIAGSVAPRSASAQPVSELALSIGRELGLRDEDLLTVEFNGLIHDLGALGSSEKAGLERIITNMLGAQGPFEGGRSASLGEESLDIGKLIALADAYSKLRAAGSAPFAAVLDLRAGVPALYEAPSVDALARVTSRR
jgi:CRP-like cAMP-binding protein